MKEKVSEKRFQIIILAVVLFLIAAVFTGYKLYAGNPKQQAQVVLEGLLSCTLQEAEHFEETMFQFATGNNEIGMTQENGSLKNYFIKQFGDSMTETCIEDLTRDRNLYRSAALAQEFQSDIKVEGLELTERTGEQESYNFSAELKTSEGDYAATASGVISMSEDGMRWVADRITMTVK